MKIFLNIFIVAVILSIPLYSLAGVGDVPDEKLRLKEPVNTPQGLLGILTRVTNWIFAVLLALAVIFILIASFRYMSAGGSEETISKAHKMLIYAAIAVAVAVLARGIVAAVRIIAETPASTTSTSEQLPTA